MKFSAADFVNSEMAAKLNGFVAGHGSNTLFQAVSLVGAVNTLS